MYKIYWLPLLISIYVTTVTAQLDQKSLNIEFKDMKLDSILNKGRSYITTSPDSIRKYGLVLLKESKRKTNEQYQAQAYRLLGISYSMLQIYQDSSDLYYKKALTLAKSLELQGDIYQSQAGLFSDIGSYDQALSAFFKCVEIFENLDKLSHLANAYGGIGNVFLDQEQFDKALHYLHKCRMIAESNDYINTLLPALANVASTYLKTNQYDSSIFYAEQCYDLSKSQDITFGIAKSAQILSTAYSKLSNFELANSYAKEAMTLFESMGAKNEAVATKIVQAEALHSMRRYQQAQVLLLEAEQDINQAIPQLKLSLYQALKVNYHALNQTEKALKYADFYHSLFKDVNEQERNNYIQQLERRFNNEKKEQQIAQLTRENEIKDLRNQQHYLLFSAAGILLIFTGMTIFFILKQRINKQKAQIATRKEQLLRSQINPHFIFNALTSIRGFLFEKNDVRNAIDYLGKFAKLMRLVLDHSSRELVSLEEEVKALNVYLEIQKMRFNNSFEYIITIDEHIQRDQVKVPPLLAQPFVENAIEHGFKDLPYPGKIELSCKQDGKLIYFSITDNGVGINSVQHKENHTSKAISIFKQRIDLIGSRFKIGLTFLIKDLGATGKTSGTKIEYTLPILN